MITVCPCVKLIFSSLTLQEEEEVSDCSFVRLSDEVRPGSVRSICPSVKPSPDLKSAWLDADVSFISLFGLEFFVILGLSPFGFYPDFVQPFS